MTVHGKTYSNDFPFLSRIPFTTVCKPFEKICNRSNDLVTRSLETLTRSNDLVTRSLETPQETHTLCVFDRLPVVSWRRAKYKQMYGLKSTLRNRLKWLEIATRDQERLQLQMRQVKFNLFQYSPRYRQS